MEGLPRIATRRATVQGTKHVQLGINNQDAWLMEEFDLPALGRRYRVGIVSDGCTGLPAFSRTEVGSNLLVLFAYARIQELVCARMALEEIPRTLFHAIIEFVRRLSNDVVPRGIHWGYPMKLNGTHADRENWSSTMRFRTDFLSATLLGFVSDGERVITFTAGDGILIVNDEVRVIDENDHPNYPASCVNAPGIGFDVRSYAIGQVRRLAILTDGPKALVSNPAFVDSLFAHAPGNPMGLQFLFNVTRGNAPEKMTDDCTAVTFQPTPNP